MKSVIEGIYYGERGTYETIEAGEEYWKRNEEYGKIYDELEKGLNEEQKKILDDLFVAGGGLEAEMALTHFKEGFKLGLLIAFEAFS